MAYLIDTDMGVDDFLALLYLYGTTRSIASIQVSGTGWASGSTGCENLLRVLHSIDRERPFRSSFGPADPLTSPPPHVPSVFWEYRSDTDALIAGCPDLAALLPATVLEERRPSPELIIDALDGQQEPVDVVALGPLTNIAAAVRSKPSIQEKVRSVTIMGGAVDADGNVPGHAGVEWNIYLDPRAAHEVFQMASSTLQVKLVPLSGIRSPWPSRWILESPPGRPRGCPSILGPAGSVATSVGRRCCTTSA